MGLEEFPFKATVPFNNSSWRSMLVWLKENCVEEYCRDLKYANTTPESMVSNRVIRIVFKNSNDAVMCKLKWG